MPELIPFRWPAEWKDASKLDLLKGTPINCLVGEVPPPFPHGDFQFVKLGKDSAPKGIALREGVWPRVLPAKSADAEAGATGGAWVDSNAGAIRLAQVLEPGKPVWLSYTPPGDNEVIPPDRFAKAVAEAGAYGARWIVTLNQPFVDGLDKAGDAAVAGWKRMVSALKLFERRSEWKTWEPVAALAVVSAFEGESQLMSAEFLNMAPRRHLGHRIVRTPDVAKASFSRQKAVIYIDSGPPAGEVRAKLLEFAQGGGLLISPRGVVTTEPAETRLGYQIHKLGKGQIAVPPEPWYDPFLLVREVHLLLSHREDVVRVWNGGDLNSHYLAAPKEDRGVVHLIPYTTGKTQPITLGFSKPYRAAKIYTLESETTVKAARGELGVEIAVGEFTSYAAVEVEA
jgi:hypothetical protein